MQPACRVSEVLRLRRRFVFHIPCITHAGASLERCTRHQCKWCALVPRQNRKHQNGERQNQGSQNCPRFWRNLNLYVFITAYNSNLKRHSHYTCDVVWRVPCTYTATYTVGRREMYGPNQPPEHSQTALLTSESIGGSCHCPAEVLVRVWLIHPSHLDDAARREPSSVEVEFVGIVRPCDIVRSVNAP